MAEVRAYANAVSLFTVKRREIERVGEKERERESIVKPDHSSVPYCIC